MFINKLAACFIFSALCCSWLFLLFIRDWRENGFTVGSGIKRLILAIVMVLGFTIIIGRVLNAVHVPSVIIVKDSGETLQYSSYYCLRKHSINEDLMVKGIWGKCDIVNLSSSVLLYYQILYSSKNQKIDEARDRLRQSVESLKIKNGVKEEDELPGKVILPGESIKVDEEPDYILRQPPAKIETQSHSLSETRYALIEIKLSD